MFCIKITVPDVLYREVVDDLRPDFAELSEKALKPECTSLAWSSDGQTLFAGFSDNLVRVWVVTYLAPYANA